jgi:hypothetical protein
MTSVQPVLSELLQTLLPAEKLMPKWCQQQQLNL